MKLLLMSFLCLLLVACKCDAADSLNTKLDVKPDLISAHLAQNATLSATHPAFAINSANLIVAVASACAAEPMLPGKVYYYCDCGTGAQADCVAGNDTNAGTRPSNPKRTIESAISHFKRLAANDTVALCKGGAFNSAGNLRIGSNRCGAGIACNDLREYSPTTFTGTAKPIINNAAGDSSLFDFEGNGGVRLLNLKLKGAASPSYKGNKAFFFYTGAHDVTMCNLDMDAFEITVYNESDAGHNNNIKLTGSYITNSHTLGYLGGGDNTEVSYNYWDGNGSSNSYDHTLYFASSTNIINMQVIGNYIRGQYGSTCQGAVMEAHMAVDGLLVKNNIIDIASAANTGGCWGIEFNNLTGGSHPVYHRNAVFSGNTIINGGNTAFTVTGCPDCIIENNLIINNSSVAGLGISVATQAVRGSVADDVNTRNIIRNNTIWYGPNANTGGTGIRVQIEGAGHIIANNTVSYTATSGTLNCYSYTLALSSYSFINNNNCYSPTTYNWEATRGSLASWRTYAIAQGFDADSFVGNPLFTTAGTDFKPAGGSPLIGAGNSTNKSSADFAGVTRPNPPAIGAYEP